MSKRLFYDNLHCSQLAFRVRDVHEAYRDPFQRHSTLHCPEHCPYHNQTASDVHYTNCVEIRSTRAIVATSVIGFGYIATASNAFSSTEMNEQAP